jgi:hypothetical protein
MARSAGAAAAGCSQAAKTIKSLQFTLTVLCLDTGRVFLDMGTTAATRLSIYFSSIFYIVVELVGLWSST